MSETSQSQAPLSRPPEDLHWGIVYLREDIQDIRGEIRAVHTRIDQTAQELRSEFLAGFQAVHNRIDQTNQRLDERFEFLIKRLDNRFLWMITTMIALSGMVVTILKM